MIDLSVRDLVKSYDAELNILNGLTFQIQAGEKVGIMGKNGSGKTTLFRILAGQEDYDSGEISFAPNKKVGLISQIPHYPEHYTVEDVLQVAFLELDGIRDQMEALTHMMTASTPPTLLKRYDELSNRFEALGGYHTHVETDKICNGLGIPSAMRLQTFATLSGGEKTRVNLARLLLEKTDILLLDEPTNHLDMHSVEWLEEYILSFPGTVLTVSHDRYFLDRTVQRIIEIRGGAAEFYSGNYSFYAEEKEARYELQLKQYEKEQDKLRQLGYTLERMKGWGINNRTLYRRAMSIQHRMERIEKTERPQTEKKMYAQFEETSFQGNEVLSLRNFSKAYGEKTLFQGVELEVKGGERIAILGDNGTGKTTFLEALLGKIPSQGRIRFGPTVKWAYLEQNVHFDHPQRTLYDTMLYETNCTPQAARDRLGAFLFRGDDVFKTVGTLSGGELSRLRLCMLMDEKVNLLLLDEPTNHLDIASREWIEEAVAGYEGTLIFVSHDRYFTQRFAERIWELEDGKIRDYGQCDYEKYRRIKAHEAAAARQKPAETAPQKEKPSRGKNDKALEKKLRALERDIEKQEAFVASFDPQIQASGQDYPTLCRLLEEKEAAETALNEMLETWETWSMTLEQ